MCCEREALFQARLPGSSATAILCRPGGEPVHCHCPLSEGTFVPLCSERGLRSVRRSPWDFKALALPPVAGKSSTLTGAACCYHEGQSRLYSSWFFTCPLLINSDCVLATAESGTSKGGPEFAMGRSVFLLASQLLPLLFAAYCIQSWRGWDTTSADAD